MTWWIPKKKFDNYYFASNINDIHLFFENHYVENNLSVKDADGITHSYMTRDESVSLGVINSKIVSAICFQEFIIESNVIGKHLSCAIVEIVNLFGFDAAKFCCDDQIVYENGDIQMDLDFDRLGIDLTVNMGGIILAVGVIGDV